ncbi:hypothetical protein HAAEEKHM_00013 [Sinorhizobium phage AP-16-3]|nr:hypothetical protein HAAEEKHM_00013 [Sinorhizobium phage AP-16-3]
MSEVKPKKKPHSLIEINCSDCGSVVETRSRKRLYCDGCIHARDLARGVEYRSTKKRPPRKYVCARCGIDGECIGRATAKYCDECRVEVRREQGRANDARRRKPTVVGFEVPCSRCGTSFIRKHGKQVNCPPCNKVVIAERSKKWAGENRDKVLAMAKAHNDKRRSTPKGHLEWTMRTAVRRALGGNEKAKRRTFDLLGYTVDDLKRHLEAQFTRGMSWENYGEWHIDHILPLAIHEYESAECPDFKRAWALTNLQPLWAKDNMSKGAKVLYLV